MSGILWREREVLDHLVGALRDGRGTEVEKTELRSCIASLEVHRAITAREVAREMGLPGDPTLQDLVVGAPDDWAPALASHRWALIALTDDLRALLRPVPAPGDGNVITLPADGQSVHRSLEEFLA